MNDKIYTSLADWKLDQQERFNEMANGEGYKPLSSQYKNAKQFGRLRELNYKE